MGVRRFGFDAARARARNGTDINNVILRRLQYIGEEMCNHARSITPDQTSGGYNDQTGNLRSSIGYRIYYLGKLVEEGGFQNVGSGNGTAEAKKALEQYHINDISGWTIVIVAGMGYARYVESKGFNVLHLTEVELNKEVEELKKDLGI